jgi:hypothetical protein
MVIFLVRLVINLFLQIMEELENLEETLNDSIQESLGARTGKPKRGSHKASLEEEEVIRCVLLFGTMTATFVALYHLLTYTTAKSKG